MKVKMSIVFWEIAFLVFVSIFQVPEAKENNKIKIVVPHKINYVHYHHKPQSKSSHLKLKKKFHLGPHMSVNYYQEDESEEHGTEEESDEHYLNEHDERADGSRRNVAYYAMTSTRVPHSASSYMKKPVFLYNDDKFYKFKHSPSYSVVKYGDSMEQEEYYDEYYPEFYFKR